MTVDSSGDGFGVTYRPPVNRTPMIQRGDLGRRLFEARVEASKKENKKVTIADMAKRFGVPNRTYHDWELGNRTPNAAGKQLIEIKLKEILE